MKIEADLLGYVHNLFNFTTESKILAERIVTGHFRSLFLKLCNILPHEMFSLQKFLPLKYILCAWFAAIVP